MCQVFAVGMKEQSVYKIPSSELQRGLERGELLIFLRKFFFFEACLRTDIFIHILFFVYFILFTLPLSPPYCSLMLLFL